MSYEYQSNYSVLHGLNITSNGHYSPRGQIPIHIPWTSCAFTIDAKGCKWYWHSYWIRGQEPFFTDWYEHRSLLSFDGFTGHGRSVLNYQGNPDLLAWHQLVGKPVNDPCDQSW